MAKLTTRDHVWAAALEVAEENATGSAWSRRFGAEDVAGRMDDPPSSKTIRETLQSMVELGALEEGRSQGQYEVRESYRELLEGDAAMLQEQLDDVLEGFAALLLDADADIVVDIPYRGEEQREPTSGELRELLANSHYHVPRDVSLALPSAKIDQELEKLHDDFQGRVDEIRNPADSTPLSERSSRSGLLMESEPEADLGTEDELEIETEPEAEFDTVEQVVGDAPPVDVSRLGVPPAVSNAITDLDLPGEGDVLVDRINLVSNVVAWIRHHGQAGRSELRENVVDPDPAGYADGYSAWKNLVQPALQDLDEVLDELQSPGEGGQAWRWESTPYESS